MTLPLLALGAARALTVFWAAGLTPFGIRLTAFPSPKARTGLISEL